jgi:hypothetical protein
MVFAALLSEQESGGRQTLRPAPMQHDLDKSRQQAQHGAVS